MKALWAGAALWVGALGSAMAEPHERVLRGTVAYVTDGDTLWLRTGDADTPPLKVRLAGIDAPERCQAHGEASRKALQAKLMDHRVVAYSQAVDAYGRFIARVRYEGHDVAAWMVTQGHAWSPGYRGRPGPYAAQERAARRARKGLFADPAAVPPSEFRHRHGSCRR